MARTNRSTAFTYDIVTSYDISYDNVKMLLCCFAWFHKPSRFSYLRPRFSSVRLHAAFKRFSCTFISGTKRHAECPAQRRIPYLRRIPVEPTCHPVGSECNRKSIDEVAFVRAGRLNQFVASTARRD